MRVYAVCERCGAKTEVHRIGAVLDLRFEHLCDTAENRAISGPFRKGPIHSVDLAGGQPDPEPVF